MSRNGTFFGKGKLNFKPLRAITSLNRYLEPRLKGVIGLSTHEEEVTRSENMKHALYERITPFPPFNVYDRFSAEAVSSPILPSVMTECREYIFPLSFNTRFLFPYMTLNPSTKP